MNRTITKHGVVKENQVLSTDIRALNLYLLHLLLLLSYSITAQNQPELTKEQQRAIETSEKHTYMGNEAYKNKKNVEAEVNYRQAISENNENAIAKYNLGNSYYKQKSYGEALVRYKQASTAKEASKQDKHHAFHNLGNIMMKKKQYDKAVTAYKQALRENPEDDETRYNLALAKEMLKKNPPQENKDNKDNQDNKENKNDKNNKDNKENKDKNQENKDNQNDKNDKNKDKDNQNDKVNNNDKNKHENNKNKDKQDQEGDDKKDEQPQGDDKKEDKGGQGNQKPQPSGISPKQMERILEALNNEEKKTQEKINAKKMEGKRTQTEKDW